MKTIKESREYWETRLPQRWYSTKEENDNYWKEITIERYTKYYPYIPKFFEFTKHRNEKVLEIGVGVGTELLQFAKNGAICYGVDLTQEGINTTKKRLRKHKVKANLHRANAEKLPFKDNFFDLVYSFGVIHHIPNMQKAIDEVHRVLKPGGKAIIWLYGKNWWYYFFVPFFHGIWGGELFRMSYDEMIHKHMEVEGNVPIVRLFRKKELYPHFKKFSSIEVYNHKGCHQSLGNKFKKINMFFCKIMNNLFPYAGWTIKVRK